MKPFVDIPSVLLVSTECQRVGLVKCFNVGILSTYMFL